MTIFGVNYVKLPAMEVCCGKPALDYGYKDDFDILRRKNSDLFQNQNIKKIITSCPKCYSVFKTKYEDIEVEHITETILENLDKIEKNYDGELITFFDACNSEKDSMLYDNPRKILEAVGFRIQELDFKKETSLCCGRVLHPISPKVGRFMGEALIESTTTRKMVTMSPDCFLHFKELNPKIEILELSEVLL